MTRLCRLPEPFLQGFGLGLFEISHFLSGIPNKGSVKLYLLGYTQIRFCANILLRVRQPRPRLSVFVSSNETRKKKRYFLENICSSYVKKTAYCNYDVCNFFSSFFFLCTLSLDAVQADRTFFFAVIFPMASVSHPASRVYCVRCYDRHPRHLHIPSGVTPRRCGIN